MTADSVVASFLGLMHRTLGSCDNCDRRVPRSELSHYSASSLADECDICDRCIAESRY